MKRSPLLTLLPVLAVVAATGAALAAAPSAYADHTCLTRPLQRPVYVIRDAERVRGERDGYSIGFDAGSRDGYAGRPFDWACALATIDLRRFTLAYQRGFRSGFDVGYSAGYRAGLAARPRHGVTFGHGHGHGHGGVTFGHGSSRGRGSTFGVRIRF